MTPSLGMVLLIAVGLFLFGVAMFALLMGVGAQAMRKTEEEYDAIRRHTTRSGNVR